MVLCNDTSDNRRSRMTSLTQAAPRLKSEILQSGGAVPGVLDDRVVRELARAVGHRGRACFWNPVAVVLTFLRQVLTRECSCRHAVAMTLAEAGAIPRERRRSGGTRRSADPSAYSQARQRLPRTLIEKLSRRVADRLHEHARPWRGHRVWVVDGTGVSMPDTPELQDAFPQPASQKTGCGFPVAHLVGLFCWSTGALVHVAVGSRHIGEISLFRRLYRSLQPHDLVVGDRLYGNYYELAALSTRGVHAVCRVNRARNVDFRRGRRLGRGDRLVTWQRPKQPARGVTKEQWRQLPETVTLRIVRVNVYCKRAWRRRRIDLVTMLLEPEAYPATPLRELYRERWLAELDLRSLKVTLGMDVLRCKSVDMVRKELAMHQIAYNLIRWLMWTAAQRHAADPQRLSFAGTQQRLLAVLPVRPWLRSPRQQATLAVRLLRDIAADVVPNRPDRHEPRAIKRRRKSFPWLVHPRHVARKTAHYDKR
jgi:hypothetical protein